MAPMDFLTLCSRSGCGKIKPRRRESCCSVKIMFFSLYKTYLWSKE